LSEAQRFQEIRENNNLSRTDFGKLVNLSADQVGKIERGDREASRTVLAKIVELFPNVTIDYILTGRDYTSSGMANNQSFVGMGEIADTSLAKSMFQTLNQISTKVETIADGVQKFDRIGCELINLKALEGTASAFSINQETSTALKQVRNDSAGVNA